MNKDDNGWLTDDTIGECEYAQIEIQAIQTAIYLSRYNKEALDFYISKVSEKTSILQADRDLGNGVKKLI